MATSKSPKKAKSKKTKETGTETKKLSALDAAAKVLAETGKPMSCNEMIEAMAAKGYWSSPSGKTPASTLYSAILKEVTTKGKESRFKKTERGRFAQT
jgi:HB1/ASXL restriction endonuclease-like protein with HTH domain